MIKRNVETILIDELNRDTILTMTGARQVGKTTLLKWLRDYLEKTNKHVEMFTLEDKYLLADLNTHPENLMKYLTQKPYEDQKRFVLIDEIQYLDDPSNFLKYIHDLYKTTIKLVVTGSSAFYIDRKYRDSLAGRKQIVPIHPLSFTEYLRAKDEITLAERIWMNADLATIVTSGKNDALTPGDKQKIERYYRDYFIYGGYPGVVLETNSERKKEVLADLSMSFLRKDILEAGIKNEIKFYELVRLLAEQCGNLTNVNELSNTLGISREAVSNYIYVLEKGFIVRKIRPFHRNIRKELGKMPKIYFLDTGFRNTIMKNFHEIESRTGKGSSLENAFFISLFHHHNKRDIRFWRTKDKNEVDFIVDEKMAFEIKFNRNNFRESGYREFRRMYPEIPLRCISFSGNYRNDPDLCIYDFLA